MKTVFSILLLGISVVCVAQDTARVDTAVNPNSFRAKVIKSYPAKDAMAAAHYIAMVRILGYDENQSISDTQGRIIRERNQRDLKAMDLWISRRFNTAPGEAPSMQVMKTLGEAQTAYRKKLDTQFDRNGDGTYDVDELNALAQKFIDDMKAGKTLADRLAEAMDTLDSARRNISDTERKP